MLIDASIYSASTLRTFDRAQSRAKAEWVDTHAHLNFSDYDEDRDEVIKKCLDNNIRMINVVGTDYEGSKKAIEIAKKYPESIFASIGMHPENIGKEVFDFGKYKELAKSKKVVAIGEIGLDYWNHPKTKKKQMEFKEKQKKLFLEQLSLARELNLPVIFHCRLAHDDLIGTIKQLNNLTIHGVVHCFTGNWEQAKKYLDMGFYLGFNGIIFKLNLDEIIKKIPLNRILLETDCPFLSPLTEVKRNEPLFVKYVAEKIAEIKSITFEEVAEKTTQNAKNLFNL
jgi:TatD DNase family protein